jgi:hypothetical protein
MATAAEYTAATEALATIVKAAIEANVPEFMQGSIPAALVSQIESEGAKAAVDAAEAVRAKVNQAT